MSEMMIYNKLRNVPSEALRPIQEGRLKGKSDINPMWRLKMLTETFGICGFGWKYTIEKQWLENGGKDEISAFVNINLYIKMSGEWSDAIPGTGGSSFVASQKNGLYTSDECFKMALTDAISVACKALGMGADVYWNADNTKYNKVEDDPKVKLIDTEKAQKIHITSSYKGFDELGLKKSLRKNYNVDSTKQLTEVQYAEIMAKLNALPDKKISNAS
jgi:hypothetical protein